MHSAVMNKSQSKFYRNKRTSCKKR